MGTEKERKPRGANRGADRESSGGEELTASRRQALARLGFAAALAYTAPTVLHLDRSAKAQILPSCQNPPGGPPDPSCNGFSPFGGPESEGGGEAPAQ